MSVQAVCAPEPASSPAPLIPVFASKAYRAWPKHDDGGRADYVSPAVAFARRYQSDAHFAAYSVPDTTRRLSTNAVGRVDVQLRLIIFDVDAANHAGSDEWWRSERAKLFDLLEEHPDGFIYRTRGGYRVVYQLSRPIEIRDDSDRYSWWALYLAWVNYLRRRFDITADPACKDWTRLFRLPHVTRDGNVEQRDTIGDPSDIGSWDCALSSDDMRDPDKVSRKSVAPAGAYTGNYSGRGRLVEAFDKHGWLGHEIEPGKLAARCPWESTHTMGSTFDTSTVIYVADSSRGDLGTFYCSHGHCQDRTVKEVIAEFSDEEMGNPPKCGATTKHGKVCPSTELFADRRCVIHSDTSDAKQKRREHSAASANAEQSQRADGLPTAPSETTWPSPIPLPSGLPPIPLFEVDLLPEVLREWIADVADRMQAPIEYAAAGAVVALAAVIGRQCGIRPKRFDTWTVIPNLWGANIGRPGIKKSPTQTEVLKPLRWLAANAHKKHEGDLKAFEGAEKLAKQKLSVLDGEIKKTLKDELSAAGDSARLEEISKRRDVLIEQQKQCEIEAPSLRRYIVNDSSIEKLIEMLSQNPVGVLQERDEMIGWLKSYERDGHENDRAFFLEAWKGNGEYVQDRIGRGTVRVDGICVSVLGSIQPGPLSDYLVGAMRGGGGADGLISRFQLMVYPDEAPWRHVDRKPDTKALARVYETFQRLDGIDVEGAEQDRDGQKFVHFDDAGQDAFDRWQADLERRLRNPDESPVMLEHLSKYGSLMPSLALIFQLADTAYEGRVRGPVSAGAAERAAKWCTLLEAHARRIYQCVTERNKTAARLLATRISAGALLSGFTAREVCRHDWGGLTVREDVEHALDLLEDLHWLRSYTVQTGGRPKTAYEINPAIVASTRKAAA
jgi:hypothetical protein